MACLLLFERDLTSKLQPLLLQVNTPSVNTLASWNPTLTFQLSYSTLITHYSENLCQKSTFVFDANGLPYVTNPNLLDFFHIQKVTVISSPAFQGKTVLTFVYFAVFMSINASEHNKCISIFQNNTEHEWMEHVRETTVLQNQFLFNLFLNFWFSLVWEALVNSTL